MAAVGQAEFGILEREDTRRRDPDQPCEPLAIARSPSIISGLTSPLIIVSRPMGNDIIIQSTETPPGRPEIAAILYISRNTTKSHLKSIYRKLGVANRRDAVRAFRAVA